MTSLRDYPVAKRKVPRKAKSRVHYFDPRVTRYFPFGYALDDGGTPCGIGWIDWEIIDRFGLFSIYTDDVFATPKLSQVTCGRCLRYMGRERKKS